MCPQKSRDSLPFTPVFSNMSYGPFASDEEIASVFNKGERYAPTVNPYNAAMHLGHMASYKLAMRYAYGRLVLDLGCGAGYGAHYLASFGANRVIAADVDCTALDYARIIYSHPAVHYLRTDGNQPLPFANGAFEFVFSSQVIEHIAAPLYFLTEIKRVLKPGGFCLITMPNKDLFSPGDHNDENENSNEFHVSEMNLAEGREIGREVFPKVEMAGIPQNCLRFAELLLDDFQMRRDNLAECENLLLFGHTQFDGQFDVTLPNEVFRASTNLAPCFWDASVGQWVDLGIYPRTAVPSDCVPNNSRIIQQRFRSPYDGLFRIDVALASKETGTVKAIVRYESESGPIVFHEVVKSSGSKLHLVFDPIPDSAGKTFFLELRSSGILGPLLARIKGGTLPQFECCGGELAFWTFHQTLPLARLK
jgi:SAM-dependent methyltransferase